LLALIGYLSAELLFFEFKAVDPATRLDRIECVITEMNHIKRRGSEAEAERSTRQDEERLVELMKEMVLGSEEENATNAGGGRREELTVICSSHRCQLSCCLIAQVVLINFTLLLVVLKVSWLQCCIFL
jgi:hypothetical protein